MISVKNLLYGLMLPSGNDAAVCLAEGFTQLLSRPQPAIGGYMVKSTNTMRLFVKQMNSLAAKLRLQSTQFTNPHGLPDKGNHSTAYDIACLTYHAMKHDTFR